MGAREENKSQSPFSPRNPYPAGLGLPPLSLSMPDASVIHLHGYMDPHLFTCLASCTYGHGSSSRQSGLFCSHVSVTAGWDASRMHAATAAPPGPYLFFSWRRRRRLRRLCSHAPGHHSAARLFLANTACMRAASEPTAMPHCYSIDPHPVRLFSHGTTFIFLSRHFSTSISIS